MVGSNWNDEYDTSYDEDDFADDDHDGADLLPCPECGAAIHEESQRCPVCNSYIVFDRGTWSGRAGWWPTLARIAVILLIVAILAPTLLMLIALLR